MSNKNQAILFVIIQRKIEPRGFTSNQSQLLTFPLCRSWAIPGGSILQSKVGPYSNIFPFSRALCPLATLNAHLDVYAIGLPVFINHVSSCRAQTGQCLTAVDWETLLWSESQDRECGRARIL